MFQSNLGYNQNSSQELAQHLIQVDCSKNLKTLSYKQTLLRQRIIVFILVFAALSISIMSLNFTRKQFDMAKLDFNQNNFNYTYQGDILNYQIETQNNQTKIFQQRFEENFLQNQSKNLILVEQRECENLEQKFEKCSSRYIFQHSPHLLECILSSLAVQKISNCWKISGKISLAVYLIFLIALFILVVFNIISYFTFCFLV